MLCRLLSLPPLLPPSVRLLLLSVGLLPPPYLPRLARPAPPAPPRPPPDHQGAKLLIGELQRLSDAGTTLVFTTHDVDLAWLFADEIALFCDGRVIGQGPALSVLADAKLLAQARLAPPLLARLGLILRDNGLLPADAVLPRDEAQLLALIAR